MVELWSRPRRRLIASRSNSQRASLKRSVWLVATFVLCTSTIGCSLTAKRIERGRGAYFAGDLITAKRELLEVADSRSPAAKTARLDLAMVELASGDPRSALKRFRESRDEFDEQSKLSLVGDAASMLTDDRQRKYKPAGYEEVMLRSMMSLCSLAVGDGDAESYAMQAQAHQTDLSRAAEERGLAVAPEIYQPLALAPYMRGVLREATHHDYDDALRSYQLVSHLQPMFAPAAMDIERCGGGAHSAPGHGVLYVFACVGRGPVLESVDAPTTTAALQIATQIYSLAENQRTMLPNLASVQVPAIRVPFSPAAAVSIDNAGIWLGATQQLVNVAQMATRQNEAEMPWTIARSLVRRVTKEVTVSQATKAVGLDGLPGQLVRFATVTAWSASEQADTRCWSLLSREIQVLRAELPIGTQRVGMAVVDHYGQPIGPRVLLDVDIADATNSYVTVIAPDQQVIVASEQ